MFHWICPECGREIAPGVKECTACDPQAAAAEPAEVLVPEAVKVLIPEIVETEPEARLRELVGRMRGMEPTPPMQSSAPSATLPWTKTPAIGVGPIAAEPRSPVGAPTMGRVRAAPKTPDVAQRLDDDTLREPDAVRPAIAPVRGSLRGATLDARLGAIGSGTNAHFLKAAIPPSSGLGAPSESVPRVAGIRSIEEQMASRVQPAAPPRCKVLSSMELEESLPGPRLPHELATFEGAGISSILRVVPDAPRPALGSAIPGWVVTSMVTATLLAGALSAAFYALPGFAGPAKKAGPTPGVEAVEAASVGSPVVEVTGIRIVAGTGKGPEIRYLVVNHSGAVLNSATVNVTLRQSRVAASAAPISRFAFTATGLGAYESREMVSPIQSMVAPAQLPDWRELRADVEIE